MRTWKDLGEEFTNLIPNMPRTFLDVQWGSAGNHWNVGGMLLPEARSRFNALSYIAGEMVMSLPIPQDYLDDLSRDEPIVRWFRVLKDLSGALHEQLPAEQLDDDGKSLGSIYHGRINNLPEVASTVCLKCELLASSHFPQGILGDLKKVGLGGAADHWRKSQKHRSSNPPDFVSAASEAIKALEGVAKEAAALPNGTLGDCIKDLRSKGKLSPGMSKCLEGLWTISNSTEGIRHGASQEVVLQLTELEFLLDSCAGAIRLLLTLNAD